MNNLSCTKVYLVGQIENDPEAAAWRVQLARRLPSINNTITVWDPMVKPTWVEEGVMSDKVAFEWKQHVLEAKSAKGESCFAANKAVRRICKQLASKCDWMIARLCKKFTWGSIDELEIAINRGIPVFLWLPDGLISIYGVAGCIRQQNLVPHYVHSDIESLLAAIDAVDKDKSDLLKLDPETWMFKTWINAGGSND